MSSGLQNKMAKGAVWMVLFKLVERSLGLVSTLILARLLTPADFGVVSMALSFIIMAELLSAFGFDIAIIQNQSATEEHYSTAWTCNFLLGVCITVLMLVMAAPIARFYQHPELMWVVVALSFGPLLNGAENIGIVAFRKDLNFRREFIFQVSRRLISFAVVIPLAFSYWALVTGILLSKGAATAMSYAMHPFRPRFTLCKFQQLFGFSRWLLFNNLVGFLKERTSDFFIGRLYGAAPLGIYNIAYEFANLPTTELSAPINRALLPGFAKMESQEEIRSAYGNALGMLALLALPAAAGIYAVAPFLVPVILGAKWLEAVPLMQILAFNGVLLMFHSSMCSLLVGRGFPGRVSWVNAAYVVTVIAALTLFSLRLGVVGAAYAVLATSTLATPLYLFELRRSLGIAFGSFLKSVIRPAIAASLMAVTVHWALPAQAPDQSFTATLMWLGIGISLGFASYVVYAVAIWYVAGRPAGAEQLVLDRLRQRFVAGPRVDVRGAHQ
jgi:O-antigen/teichoic acid export membrane protein